MQSYEAESASAWGPPVVEQGDVFPWWSVAVLGAVSVLLGVVVLVWPGETLRVLAVLVGIWLLVAGVARIFGAFLPGRGVGRAVLSGIVGVLLVIGGVLCLRNLVNGLVVLAVIVALTWMFSGLAEIMLAFAAHGGTRALLLVTGILSVIAGFLFLVWPGLSLTVLIVLTGISAIVIGIGELVVAFQLRKAVRAA
jgi:uncharacterized membrane protein HdeD (DUF308 family)